MACMAISILLVSGPDWAALVFDTCGLGPPQAAKSKTTATTDHTLMRMGKHCGQDQSWLKKC